GTDGQEPSVTPLERRARDGGAQRAPEGPAIEPGPCLEIAHVMHLPRLARARVEMLGARGVPVGVLVLVEVRRRARRGSPERDVRRGLDGDRAGRPSAPGTAAAG